MPLELWLCRSKFQSGAYTGRSGAFPSALILSEFMPEGETPQNPLAVEVVEPIKS
jgi:hypothetical protein